MSVNIRKSEDGTYKFTQPVLIDTIINDFGLGDTEAEKKIPINAQMLLHHHLDSEEHDIKIFNYRSVIGKLNYLAQVSRPDILYAVLRCARLSHNPCKEHREAVLYLARYLKGNKEVGFKFKPDASKSFEVFADKDYCRIWTKKSV